MNLNKFIDLINEYTDYWSLWGILKLVFDIIIVTAVIVYFILC